MQIDISFVKKKRATPQKTHHHHNPQLNKLSPSKLLQLFYLLHHVVA